MCCQKSYLVIYYTGFLSAGPLKCCTNYSPNPFPLNRLKHFSIQDATGVCRLSAVIFTTLKNKKICADPEAAWVKDAVSHIKTKAKPN
ncbi:monocyte chemotactic protein 1B-like [Astyanax mexicanus]|uniref:Monocyte chemotactic protein 1B-like n=1 Tax=Astyanax mexicanus TaxID=7994 RepID=A0A8T2M1L8_ASTMX|nr:monocyte chemotactic protein 1B-like [Astyanax mexicanus]